MKKIKTMSLSLALLAANNCLAEDYICKEIYETSTKRMREIMKNNQDIFCTNDKVQT